MSKQERELSTITHGLMIVEPFDEKSKNIELHHFVGYWKKPTQKNIEHLREELKTDEEFGLTDKIDELIVITDNIPLSKKKKAIEKAIKLTLAEMLPDKIRYRIYHHSSRSHFGLQIADYCNWAIFRRWERDDADYWIKIRPCIKSEFNIFQRGSIYYY